MEQPPANPSAQLSLSALVEAVILAAPEPVTVRQMARVLCADENRVQLAIDALNADYNGLNHGIFLRFVRGGYQLATKPALGEELRELLRGIRPPAPLSLAAVQTLAIVAYKQPVSASEIHAIRRIEAPGVIRTLLKRKLIAPAGRKPQTGALLYKTTPLFLAEFGLRDLSELQTLEQFGERK